VRANAARVVPALLFPDPIPCVRLLSNMFRCPSGNCLSPAAYDTIRYYIESYDSIYRGLSLKILGNRENVGPPTTEQEYGHMDKRRRH